MKISFYCARRGEERVPWDDFLKRTRAEGYDGVETSLPLTPAEQEPILKGLEKYGLKLIAVNWDRGAADFTLHARELELRLRSLLGVKAVLIVSHTGKDYFSFEQNTQLLLVSKRLAQENNVTIIHETRRGRFSFAAHVARQYLDAIPSLRLNLDLSHWFTVADSFLEDQAEAVELAIARTAHIHAEIGYTPQHLVYWDKVVERHRRAGAEEMGMTCDREMITFLKNRYGR